MSDHFHGPHCACTTFVDDDTRPAAARLRGTTSRRGLLGAAAMGLTAVGLSRAVSANGVPRASKLDTAGEALLPAERIPAPTTTLPEQVPAFPFEPPADGEILFPIVVAEGERCGVLNNFGDTRGRPAPYYHQACDIMADEGLPLRAVVDGELTKRYEGGFYGWTLYDDVNDVVYKYFHNTSDANGFEVGNRVKQGDIIGFVGDTGTAPGNFHLHFEYRPGNTPADPYHLLQRQEHVEFW